MLRLLKAMDERPKILINHFESLHNLDRMTIGQHPDVNESKHLIKNSRPFKAGYQWPKIVTDVNWNPIFNPCGTTELNRFYCAHD